MGKSSREKSLQDLGTRARKKSPREKSLRELGNRARMDSTDSSELSSEPDDDDESTSSSSDDDENVSYQEFKRVIRKAFHRVSKERLEGNTYKVHAKIHDSVKEIFKKVDAFGNREIGKKVFKKKLANILRDMDECVRLTKKRDFKENLSLLVDDIDSDHDKYISMAEFVAFYLYDNSELKKIVKKLSREINKKGADDLAYIRKWKTIFSNDTASFNKASLELLFEEIIEVSLTSSEVDLIWNNIANKQKNSTSIRASKVQRFFKNNLAANLHWIEQDHDSPIYDIQVSVTADEEDEFKSKGYLPLSDKYLNKGKFGAERQIWYTHKKGDFFQPIIDVKLYPLKESTTLFADGYTCVQKSINTGYLGSSSFYKSRLIYIWFCRGPSGKRNEYAVTNMHVVSGDLKDRDNMLEEIPCGGYEKVRGNMTNDKDKATFLFILRREISPKMAEATSSVNLYSTRGDASPRGSHESRLSAKRIETEKINDSRESVELYERIYHRIRLEIRMKYSKTSDDLDMVQNLYQKYAKSNHDRGWSKQEFRQVMQVLNVHVQKKIWDQLNALMDYSDTGYINQHDFRDFVTLRPRELDEYAQKIKTSVVEEAEEDDSLDRTIKGVFKHYASDGKALTQQNFFRLVKDYNSDNLTESEIRRLMLYFDHAGDGRIRLKEFKNFFHRSDSILKTMSSKRVVHTAGFLMSYLQSEYGEKMNSNHGDWGKSAKDMWEKFDNNKSLDGVIRAHELNKIIKLASSKLHQGVSYFLSYDELVALMEYIQPGTGNSKHTPTINYNTFCNFFGFGEGDEKYVTDIKITHDNDDSVEQEEQLAATHFRADVSYVREGSHGHDITKLWVKYGSKSGSNRQIYPIRQVKVGPINCSLKKREGWKMIQPYLYKDKAKKRMFLWYSSENDPSFHTERGIKHLKLQETKPSSCHNYQDGKVFKYTRCDLVNRSDDKSPLWVLNCKPTQVTGFAIASKVTASDNQPIEVNDKVQVKSSSTMSYENAVVERIRLDGIRMTYDIMFTDDHTRKTNVPQEQVRKSIHMMRSNNELNSSFHIRKNKKASNFRYSENVKEVRGYLKKEARDRHKRTKRHHGKRGHDVKGFFEHHVDDHNEGYVLFKRFHRFLENAGVVHNSHTDDMEILREIDCNGDDRIDVQDITTFIFKDDPDAIVQHQTSEYTSDIDSSSEVEGFENEAKVASKAVTKLIKKIKKKVKHKGTRSLKSKGHKVKKGAISIRYMKSTVENMLGGSSINKDTFISLVKKTRSLDEDGNIMFKKFISYFGKDELNSSSDSEDNVSSYDEDSELSESDLSEINSIADDSDFDTDSGAGSSDIEYELKTIAKSSTKRRKNGNKINNKSQVGMWQLYKTVVTSKIKDPAIQVESWVRKLRNVVEKKGGKHGRTEHVIEKVLRKVQGLSKTQSKNVIKSALLKSGKNKSTLSLGKLKNQLVGMTIKSASALNPQHGRGDNDKAFEKIKSVMKRTNLSIGTITETFEEYDIKYNDTVALKDLRTISGHLGFGLNMQEIRSMLDSYKDDGRVNYRLLLKDAVSTERNRGKSTDSEEVDTLIKKTKRLLKESEMVRGNMHGNKVQKAFEYYDLAGTGVVTKDQFELGLEKLGVSLKKKDIQTFLKHFGYGGDQINGVDYRQFSNSIQENDANVDLIQQKIKRDLFSTINNGVGYFDLFSSYDLNGDGKVTRLSFRKSLEKLNIKLQEDELRKMMDKFDLSSDGRVDYGAFYRWVAPFGSKASVDVEALQSRLQHLIRQSAMTRPSTFDMRDAFAYFDHGNTGLVTRGQFSRSLKDMNLALSKGELSYLMDRFGRQNHDVDYQTFANFAKCNELEMDTISTRLQSRFDDIAREGIDYREIFEMFDERGTGFITRNEFKEAARQLGLPLTVTQLYALMERFSHFAGGDKISYHDVLEFVGFRHKKLNQTNTVMTIVQNPRNRETIDGSGHDGFHYTRRGEDMEEMSNKRMNHANSLIPPRTVEKWLDKKATDKQREAFSEVFSAIHQYDKTSSYLGDAIVDHTTGTVSRFVSHLPYELAGTVSSTFNRRRRNKKKTSRNQYSSDSEDDARSSRRGRDTRKNKKKIKYHRSSESESDSDDYNSRKGRRRNRSTKGRSKGERSYSPRSRNRRDENRYRRSDSEDDSDYSRGKRRKNTSRRGRSSPRRNRRSRRKNYSSDSD